jgi:Ulp1 family protease
VPRQNNQYDCGCFTVFFGKKFFNDPEATLALLRVVSFFYFDDSNIDSYFQTRFTSGLEAATAWGLKGGNMKFVRREIRALLFKYINDGQAVVEYE